MRFRIFFLLLFVTTISFAQDAEQILESSIVKCQSVTSGSFGYTEQMKFMSDNDTFVRHYNFQFIKSKNTLGLFPDCIFYYNVKNDNWSNESIYTGDEIIWLKKNDTAIIMKIDDHLDDAINSLRSISQYDPITSKKSKPLNADHSEELVLLGEEMVGSYNSYHLRALNIVNDKKAQFSIRTLSVQYDYWINKEDSIPVQYSVRYILMMGADTVVQYNIKTLTSYDLSGLKDTTILTMDYIPDHFAQVPYEPWVQPTLLEENTEAPDWKLATMNGDSLQLSDLRGKVVVLDFFYSSCGPCIGAMPGLEKMHKEFGESGLVVIGVNPYDTMSPKFKDFIDQRVTYTVVFDQKKVNKDYKVSGYPTVYILDRNGIIVYKKVGYGNRSEKEMRRFVKKLLKE